MHQSLKARCILDDKLLKRWLCFQVELAKRQNYRDTNTPESGRDDLDATEAVDLAKLKGLKHNAAGKQPAEGRLGDADIIELEPLQHREGGINLGQIAPTDAGGAQPGSEAERGWRQGQRQQARPSAVSVELELLEAIEDGGPKPAVEFGVAVAAETDGFEGEAADGAAVRGEDLGDGGDAVALLPGEVVVDGEVERGGPPDVAPSGGENGCPRGALGAGEAGEDDAAEIDGELADEVEARILAAIPARRRLLRFRLVPLPLLQKPPPSPEALPASASRMRPPPHRPWPSPERKQQKICGDC